MTQRERQTHLSLLLNTSIPVETHRFPHDFFFTKTFKNVFDFFEFTRTADFVTGGGRVSYGWLGRGGVLGPTFKRRAMTRHISDIARRT